jgi:opacity protein-like surface antigen
MLEKPSSRHLTTSGSTSLKKIILVASLLLSLSAYSQEDVHKENLALVVKEDTAKVPKYGWKHSVVSGITLGQVSFTDWAQGGENSLSYGLLVTGKSEEDQQGTNWSNSYKFAFGQTRLSSQGIRKTDDEIAFETLFRYKLQPKLGLYASATLLTQFAKGYTYAPDGASTAISSFFDPAYMTQSVGVIYTPIPEITTRIGPALREVVTSTYNQYADDPKTTEIEKVRLQGGLESVTGVRWELMENVLFTSRLAIFMPFKTMDRMVVRNDNGLAVKLGKALTMMLTGQIWVDPDVSPRTQFKESIALGLSYNFF